MWVRGLKQTGEVSVWCHEESHPMWVRGLKQLLQGGGVSLARVASYVGAWIETLGTLNEFSGKLSHPMWVRGLKLCSCALKVCAISRILCGCVD
mgnify:CR=1 FL=1